MNERNLPVAPFVLAVLALLVVIGSFTPWATLGDGLITLGLEVIALLFSLLGLARRRPGFRS
jgi:hypothetical protein